MVGTVYGKFADKGDNPVDNLNMYNVKGNNRLSLGQQPLTTESVLKTFFLNPVP